MSFVKHVRESNWIIEQFVLYNHNHNQKKEECQLLTKIILKNQEKKTKEIPEVKFSIRHLTNIEKQEFEQYS